MAVDTATLLRELDLVITAGGCPGIWCLRSGDGLNFDVAPTPAVQRVEARHVRMALAHGPRPLLVGESATPMTVERAEHGLIDLLTAHPLRLIQDGKVRAVGQPAAMDPSARRARRGRPAWITWALQRRLLLAEAPERQAAIAARLGTSQQAISRAAQMLAGFIQDDGAGLVARDRRKLLEHWMREYPGPGGQEFGWYSLAPPREQASAAVAVATARQMEPVVGGDVAADVLAPWKRPSRARLYLRGPVDLSDDGFVPAPLEEATLLTCVPQDPTLWRLVSDSTGPDTASGFPLADAPTVLWDLVHSDDLDGGAAAEKLTELLVGALP